jgi:hypothetical protein
VAFFVSQRLADFMAVLFREQGLRAVAAHAGPHQRSQGKPGELLGGGGLRERGTTVTPPR